jgi:hypothetical protein
MREFRANQGKYLGIVKNGTELILKSRENGSFVITPITEYHTIIPQKYILAPDEDLKWVITGEELLERVIPWIEKLFEK